MGDLSGNARFAAFCLFHRRNGVCALLEHRDTTSRFYSESQGPERMKPSRLYTLGSSMDRRGFLTKVGQGLGLATMASMYAEAQGVPPPTNLRVFSGVPGATPTAPVSNAA